ncbi:cysteine dioxygenase [Flexivirga caeni]|uniref:Cupin domain-containing protein n=1 Tax=Flexivirga caeni TaxID=2294115 RepID=A0A3M9M2T6_9MICO|nr:cysteine dioxygenase family protein [Flexivirga caeni]RNI19884.1 cupin domain-containing protein [Flexivirga caeni]
MTTTSPGVRDFTKDQLVRMARLFAHEAGVARTIERSGAERKRHQLTHTPHLEVWVMTWPPGASTDWHDHGAADGAMVVVEGELIDVQWRGGSEHWLELRPGDDAAVAAGTAHSLTNVGDGYAVTIHAYAPGLTEMTPYTWENGRPVAIQPGD